MHRRTFLAATMPATAALIAFPTNASPTVDPRERLDAAIAELKEAVAAVYPQVIRWADIRYEEEGHAVPLTLMAFGFVPSEPPTFTGPGVYEFDLLDTLTSWGSPVRPHAFLDRAAKRGATGEWFRWQHYHKGKFEGRGRYVPASRLRIVRKLEALG
jgi:hypothetical protein